MLMLYIQGGRERERERDSKRERGRERENHAELWEAVMVVS